MSECNPRSVPGAGKRAMITATASKRGRALAAPGAKRGTVVTIMGVACLVCRDCETGPVTITPINEDGILSASFYLGAYGFSGVNAEANEDGTLSAALIEGIYGFSGVTGSGSDAAALSSGLLSGDYTPPEITFNYSDCLDEFSIVETVPNAAVWTIQISSDGVSWADHVFIVGDGTEQTITLNNDYNGDYFFRVVDGVGNVRRASQTPLPSTVAPPTITSITNVADATGTRPLRADDGFVYPYSNRENEYISPTETYVVPRGRYYLDMTVDQSIYQLPNVVSVSGEVGSVTKWTRDGNDPTIDTVIAKLEGTDNNAAVYRNDFRLIIKARSFKDGCRSPMTAVLVDKYLNILPDFDSHGDGQTTSGYCDLPINGSESGNSCQTLYGGTAGFDSYLFGVTDAALQSNVIGDLLVYRQIDNPTTSTYLGWPIHSNAWNLYYHTDSVITRNATVISMPESFTYAKAQLSTEGAPTEMDAGVFGSAFGSAATLQANLTLYIQANFPVGDHAGVTLVLLAPYFTLHNDEEFFADPDYDPPVVNDPPETPYNPSQTIYGDDFEAYLDGTAVTLTLNEGTGWSGAWTIVTYVPSMGQDTFDQDTDGTATTGLSGGDLWSGVWHIFDYAPGRIGQDDMQDYTDGVVGGTRLSGGEGWVGDWAIFDYALYRNGSDDMQSYSDGVIPSGVSTMKGGDGWESSTGWVFPI